MNYPLLSLLRSRFCDVTQRSIPKTAAKETMPSRVRRFNYLLKVQDRALQACSNFWVCGQNLALWPFKWNLFHSTFTWCYTYFFLALYKMKFDILFLFFEFQLKSLLGVKELALSLPRPTLQILLCLTPEDFTLSNARRFYSSIGDPYDRERVTDLLNAIINFWKLRQCLRLLLLYRFDRTWLNALSFQKTPIAQWQNVWTSKMKVVGLPNVLLEELAFCSSKSSVTLTKKYHY